MVYICPANKRNSYGRQQKENRKDNCKNEQSGNGLFLHKGKKHEIGKHGWQNENAQIRPARPETCDIHRNQNAIVKKSRIAGFF
jgi:hypothetical protein